MSSLGAVVRTGFAPGPYPERPDEVLGWLDQKGDRLAGAVIRRLRAREERARRFAERVAALSAAVEDLSEAAFAEAVEEVRTGLRRHGFREEEAARSFALVREAARRHIGKRHFDVQIMGGWVLLAGMVAEMETGEGKTLTATLAASTAALAGLPVHVISVNDYLVARDAEEMGPIYRALGLSVGVVVHGLKPDERRAEYGNDVTYTSNKEVAFDYLRDRIAMGRMRTRVRLDLERLARGRSRAEQMVLRGLCFGIVDEADSVLVDEARTPLIISGGNDNDHLEEEVYQSAVEMAGELETGRDFVIDDREHRVVLTESGEERLEVLAKPVGGIFKGPHRRSEFVSRALAALHVFQRDKHYLVADGKVQIIDEYTGRVMPDRTWQHGLHQMIEAKEGLEISGHSEPLAQISYQRLFRRYLRLAGMTGTAREVAGELWSVYRLAVVRIPTHRALRRQDWGSRVYQDGPAKWSAIVERIQSLNREGRPVLIGTRSVSASENLSALLDEAGLAHRVLNARQDKGEAEVVAEAGQPARITVATNMAGRGTDIRLPPDSLEAGGLHVIATERHESHRIDRQLYGRCGRQGDPGSFEMVVSLDDELIRAHGRALPLLLWLEDLLARGRPADETSWLRNLAARLAQRRAERLHAKLRSMLLAMDERTANMLAFSGKGE
jgi:preprotein translocase subunit SecA